MAAALDAGADDMRDDGDNWEVIVARRTRSRPCARRSRSWSSRPAREVAMLPQNYVKLEGKAAQQMMRLMEALDDHDDVQNVWSNFDIEEKEIEASLA